MKTKIRLYLMTEKGYEILKFFISEGKQQMIDSVISARDNNVKDDYYDRIYEVCKLNNLNFYNRNELAENVDNTLIRLAIGWRWLIESNLKSEKLLVIHDSLLPKYRGFAPLVSQLINGDKILGATLLMANSSFDKGSMIFQESFEISYPIKINRVIKMMIKTYISITSKIIDLIEKNKVFELVPQNEKLATYSIWRDDLDYFINWDSDSGKIMRFVDAVGFPYSGAKTRLNNLEVFIDEAETIEDVEIMERGNHIGKIIFVENGFPVVICRKGLIKIKSGRYAQDGESIIPIKKFRCRFN